MKNEQSEYKMHRSTTITNYDANALDFDNFRQPNSVIAGKLNRSFADVHGSIMSIGCGTGQYEAILSKENTIVGLDRSFGMVQKAKSRIFDIVLGDMTSLPFEDKSFSGAYFVQSLHHVGANLKISKEERETTRLNVLRDTIRVIDTGPIFIVQRDPSQNQAVWFWKYFPRSLEVKLVIQPKIDTLVKWLKSLGIQNISKEPVDDPMIHGFYDPSSPLDPGFRRSFSEFSYLSVEETEVGLKNLQEAIRDGSVFDDIEACKLRFAELGGTVFVVSGEKV